MLESLKNKLDQAIYDGVMAVGLPILYWWVERGLKREDLSEEIKEFWNEWRNDDSPQ